MRSEGLYTSFLLFSLRNVKQRFELDDELPLLVGNIFAIKLLEAVDAGTRDETVECIAFFELATVRGLRATHLNLDGYRGLALFADWNLLVVTLNTSAVRSN